LMLAPLSVYTLRYIINLEKLSRKKRRDCRVGNPQWRLVRQRSIERERERERERRIVE
jgi:hypothetical protein